MASRDDRDAKLFFGYFACRRTRHTEVRVNDIGSIAYEELAKAPTELARAVGKCPTDVSWGSRECR